MNAAANQLTLGLKAGVSPDLNGRFDHVKNIYVPRTARQLTPAWHDAIAGWTTWLQISGKRNTTIRVRRDHMRSIAIRSRSEHPAEVTLNHLVILCSERAWSNEHRKSVRASLVSFFGWAVVAGIVETNRALALPPVAAPMPRPRPTPDDIWEELLANAPPRERLMARLAGEAGLRRSEVAVVHYDDILHEPDGWALLVHGKGGKQRVVGLTEGLAAEIRGQFTRRGYLFPGNINGHLSPGWVGIVLSRLMPPGWTMHKLRHRFATRGYAGTKDLRAVQEALGHSSPATTQRYTAVSSTQVRLVSEAAASVAYVRPEQVSTAPMTVISLK